MKFLASTLIWLVVFQPMLLLSFFIVPFMLLTKWDGKTTWFGNYKYGRGDTHYKNPSNGEYWKQLRFLTVRNPVSNFGKQVLSVKTTSTWAWFEDVQVYKAFYWKFGWKNPSGETPELRTLIYRPYWAVTKPVTPPL